MIVKCVLSTMRMIKEEKLSNSLLNYHISDGCPAGENAGLYEIADYYGDLLFSLRPIIVKTKSTIRGRKKVHRSQNDPPISRRPS